MALLDMARARHGEVRLLPESRTAERITPRLLIFHSIVGSARSAHGHFLNGSNLESTFIVAKSGLIWQTMDTERQADANYRANRIAGSVETGDDGDPNSDPWTPQQLDALAWIAWQYHQLHGVPLRRADRPDGAGIGYHTLFGAPSPWTPVAKSCPGIIRIRQFDQVLLPRIVAGPGAIIPIEEDDWMANPSQWTDADKKAVVEVISRGITAALTASGSKNSGETITKLLTGVNDIKGAIVGAGGEQQP
jgi:hypothetical protein